MPSAEGPAICCSHRDRNLHLKFLFTIKVAPTSTIPLSQNDVETELLDYLLSVSGPMAPFDRKIVKVGLTSFESRLIYPAEQDQSAFSSEVTRIPQKDISLSESH